MAVYLDTSVLAGFVSGEPGWHEASDRIASFRGRCIGDFTWGEFVDTLARKVRNRELSEAGGRATAAGVRRFFSEWSWIAADPADIRVAAGPIEGDLRLSLKFADAIHLATAKRLNAVLRSFDKQQVSAARVLGIDCINPFEETT